MKTISTFEAIGTQWQIVIEESGSVAQHQEILKDITRRIDEFDQTYSRFRSDSFITTMSREKGIYTLPDDAQELFTLYKKLYEITDHTVTPFIGDVLVNAGYDAGYSLVPQKLSTPPLWEESIAYEYPHITVKKPTLLDFGAVGKGYLIDIIGTLLESRTIDSYTIDAGGDMIYKTSTHKALQVGLEHPDHPDQVIGIASIRNQSICCSAGNRRKWKNFHHLINPHTLTSPTRILSTWVIAKTAMIADAIATCLFFVPAKKLHEYFDFSYALIYHDYSLESSRNFPGEFFTTKNTLVV